MLVDCAAKKYLPLTFFDDDETRQIFHYLNASVEIPMRNIMKTLVVNRFEKMQSAVKKILIANCSKLSFTLDGWSSITRKSYIGITCHYIDNDWNLHSLLLDFVPSHGLHAGKDTAKSFFETIEDFQITQKVLGITVDNTRANFRFMKELSYLIPFDYKNQHFQCYSHILNIAVQAMLKQLGLEITSEEDNVEKENEEEIEDDGNEREESNDDELNEILSEVENCFHASPLSKLRNLFKILKNSEQWRNKLQSSCQLCDIKMLSANIDSKTMWDSTCDMIFLGLRLQKALILLCENNTPLNNLIITDNEWLLLQEIYKYLRHFKVLSKSLGGEKHPTLNLVVVGLNILLDKIKDSINDLKKKVRNSVEDSILAALKIGLEKLLKHYKSNWIYCVILILDPRHKLLTFDSTKWGREMKKSSLEIFKNIYKSQYYKAPEETVLSKTFFIK